MAICWPASSCPRTEMNPRARPRHQEHGHVRRDRAIERDVADVVVLAAQRVHGRLHPVVAGGGGIALADAAHDPERPVLLGADLEDRVGHRLLVAPAEDDLPRPAGRHRQPLLERALLLAAQTEGGHDPGAGVRVDELGLDPVRPVLVGLEEVPVPLARGIAILEERPDLHCGRKRREGLLGLLRQAVLVTFGEVVRPAKPDRHREGQAQRDEHGERVDERAGPLLRQAADIDPFARFEIVATRQRHLISTGSSR